MAWIDFLKVRPHGGDRRHGFEELCCQLAALEPATPGSAFYRKGIGGDAGVECYRIEADGSETGWQAKFFDKFGSSQTQQLDDSLAQALKLHTQLRRYVVCLPINLSDARVGKAMSQIARWQAWSGKWAGPRAGRKAPLEIELWGASQLLERLTREDGRHVGRRIYWFDDTVLTSAFFKQSLRQSIADLGPRYSPEVAVSLPIRQELLAFARAPLVPEQALKLAEALDDARHGLATRVATVEREIGTAAPVDVTALTDGLMDLLVRISRAGPADYLPWLEVAEEADDAEDESRQLFGWVRNGGASAERASESEAQKTAQANLFRLRDVIEKIRSLAGGRQAQLTNATSVLLHGEAGSGKSHLLADVAAYQTQQGKPALLVLGNRFSQDDPWTWLQQRLGLGHLARADALGALDAAAEAAGCRGLILVDAINERPGLTRWQDTVGGFLQTVRPYSHLGILVSCRSTYLPAFEGALAGVPRIEHAGFHGTNGRAAAAYLARRGIVRPGAPYFSPEFNNPLFLRSCCDFLDRQGQRVMPRGLRGVTAVFDFYLGAVTDSVGAQLGLTFRARIPDAALKRLTEAIVAAGDNRIAYDEARAITEAVLPAHGQAKNDLLEQFESEGVLTVEPSEDGSDHYVRFTFERLVDHLAAQRLLEAHMSVEDPMVSFGPGTPLYDLITGEDAYSRAGILEAIAVQLPERIEAELPDLVGPLQPHCPAWNAFAASLAWRRQDAFRKRTMELICEYDRVHRTDLALRTRLVVASEPENPFNARDLDRWLRQLDLPERDSIWSVGIARLVEDRALDCPARVLVDWAREAASGQIDADRAKLAAVTLSWFLSVSHREIRDRATKALAALLARHLPIAAALVTSFSTVDDPYIVERVLCAAYGAAMLTLRLDGLEALAAAAMALLKSPLCPVHLLSRDYAHGIVAFARFRGCLPLSANIRDAEPPYRSPWPLEVVSEQEMESFTEKSRHGTFRDTIVSSTDNFGDFGRYIIQSRIRSFAAGPARPSGQPPNRAELLASWMADFEATKTPAQALSLSLLVQAWQSADASGASPTEAVREASKRFEATLDTRQLHEYWNRARSALLPHFPPGRRRAKEMAPFSQEWASRWVCWRAHSLGWNPEMFSAFERNDITFRGRMEHRVERIGKKYQWIALHELLARLADHVAFKEEPFDEKADSYKGPWQIGARDIDPSLAPVVSRAVSKNPECWWAAPRPSLPHLVPADRMDWIDYDGDLLNRPGLVEATDPSGRAWFVLNTFANYCRETRSGGRRHMEQEAWYQVSCLVCRKRDRPRLLRALEGQQLANPDTVPGYGRSYRQFLGEYPWHPAWSGLRDWMRLDDPHGGKPIPIRRPSLEYLAESGGYDYSIDGTMCMEMPAPWLLDGLGARLSNGEQPAYVNGDGQTVFFDPSITSEGPSAALVDKEAFLSMLETGGLTAVWTVAGEKTACGAGGRLMGFRYGGSRRHSGVYSFLKGALAGSFWSERSRPTPEQLKEFLAD